jgi:Tol biopolymer transport system component
MRKRRWLFIPIVVVVVVGLGLVYLQLAPRVLGVSPEAGESGVLSHASIELVFSREMDAASVEENLAIEPPQEGSTVWDGNTLIFTPDAGWPKGETITARLGGEARSSLGLQIGRETAWSFDTASVLLAYLYPADGPVDLYALDVEGEQIYRFTVGANVLDFDVQADGMKLYFSAANSAGGSDLYVYDRLAGESRLVLGCGADRCRNARIDPAGEILAFERSSSEGESRRIFLIDDLSHPEAEPVERFGESHSPLWSASGWLSYYQPALKRFVFLRSDSGERATFANESGEPGAWLPSGEAFIAPELLPSELSTLRGPSGEAQNQQVDPQDLESVEAVSSRLMAFDLAQGQVRDLTRDPLLEDTAPAVSPNGRLLAFARKYIDAPRWTPGRQLWLMPVSGGQAFMLTNEPNFKYSEFAWHPDGFTIAFVRFNQLEITDPPELWVIDTDGREAMQLIIGGFAPQWIP